MIALSEARVVGVNLSIASIYVLSGGFTKYVKHSLTNLNIMYAVFDGYFTVTDRRSAR